MFDGTLTPAVLPLVGRAWRNPLTALLSSKEVIIVIGSGFVFTKNKVTAAAARVTPALMAAFMVLFLVSPAFPEMSMPAGSDSTLQGKVVAVKNMSDLTVLTIQTGKGIDNEVNVLVAPYTNAQLCSDREYAMDVSPGDRAIVKYHELSGLVIADSIAEKC